MPTIGQRLNAVLYTIFFGLFASVIVRFVLPRVVGPSDLGVYATVDALSQIICLLTGWGFASWIPREFSKKNFNHNYSGDIVHAMIILSMFSFIILYFSLIFLNYTSKFVLLSFPVALWIGMQQINLVLAKFYELKNLHIEAGKYTRQLRIIWVIVSLLNFYLKYLGLYDSMNCLIIFAATSGLVEILRAIIFLKLAHVPVFQKISSRNILFIIKASFWFFLSSGLVMLYTRIPTLILSKTSNNLLDTEKQVGIYYAAVTLTSILGMFVPGITSVMYPSLSKLYHSNIAVFWEEFREYFFVIILASGFMSTGLIVASSLGINLLFGKEFSEAWKVLCVAAPTVVISYALVTLQITFMIQAKEKLLVTINCVGVVGIFISCYFFLTYGFNLANYILASLSVTVNEIVILIATLITLKEKQVTDKRIALASAYVTIFLIASFFLAKPVETSGYVKIISYSATIGLVYISGCLTIFRKDLVQIFSKWRANEH